MNTTNQSIPTAFAPETAFALFLQTIERNEKLPQEIRARAKLNRFTMQDREPQGIPESALND